MFTARSGTGNPMMDIGQKYRGEGKRGDLLTMVNAFY